MKVAAGVEMLEISANIMGKENTVNPALIWDDETAILVDAGYPGQQPLFKEAVEKAGVSFDKINDIILTHHDIDHIGSASSIKAKAPERINILAHEEESPYIEGVKCPLKLAQLEARLDVMPEKMKPVYEKLKAGFENSKIKVDTLLKDGDRLPYCGGITVIHTPGHTLGHICLYLEQSKILIAGDLLTIENGVPAPFPRAINYDHDMYLNSIKKLAQYDIHTIICYHGGLFKGDVYQIISGTSAVTVSCN